MKHNRKHSKASQPSLLKKTNGLKLKSTAASKLFETAKRQSDNLQISSSSICNGVKKVGLNHHFASSSQLLYSPFRPEYYLPPHLNSSQMQRTVFKAENPSWKARPSSARKYDYDTLYERNEQRFESAGSSNKWKKVKSRIKYLLDEDRAVHYHFSGQNNVHPHRQVHPDDDLSEESSMNDI